MIRVTIYMDGHHVCQGFDLEGHAGFAESGADIVCAAISMLTLNTLNALERYTQDQTSCVSEEEEGRISFRFCEEPSHDAGLLVQTMILGLESLEENREYEPYIDIIFREV